MASKCLTIRMFDGVAGKYHLLTDIDQCKCVQTTHKRQRNKVSDIQGVWLWHTEANLGESDDLRLCFQNIRTKPFSLLQQTIFSSKSHNVVLKKVHPALLRLVKMGGENEGEVFNNRGIIYPVMALTTKQRPPGRDQSRSQQIRHTQQLSHTLLATIGSYDAVPLHKPSLRSFSHQLDQ